uniref:Uncharacterized protein n=1 Tax=Oryza nivara TaxID=4536 RepID=A0A0E0HIJ4_ORYNI
MPPPIPHSPLAQVGAKGEVRQSASQPPRPLHGRGDTCARLQRSMPPDTIRARSLLSFCRRRDACADLQHSTRPVDNWFVLFTLQSIHLSRIIITYIYNEGIYTQKEELFEGLKDNSSIDWEAVAADIISRTGRVFHTSDSSTGSTINIVTVRQQNQDRFAHVPIE